MLLVILCPYTINSIQPNPFHMWHVRRNATNATVPIHDQYHYLSHVTGDKDWVSHATYEQAHTHTHTHTHTHAHAHTRTRTHTHKCEVSRVTCDVSRVTCHMWRVTCDVSQYEVRCQCTINSITCHVWHVTCDVSHVTCHMWRVTCDVSHVKRIRVHMWKGLGFTCEKD